MVINTPAPTISGIGNPNTQLQTFLLQDCKNLTSSKMPSHESSQTYVPTFVPWKTRLTWQLRLKFFLTGVLFPVICLAAIAIGFGSSIEAPWQSGRWDHYVIVLTTRPTIFVFWPLLVFSFFCLSRWCLNPHKHNSTWMQIGLVTGVIQALVFTVLLSCTSGPLGQIMAVCWSIVSPVRLSDRLGNPQETRRSQIHH